MKQNAIKYIFSVFLFCIFTSILANSCFGQSDSVRYLNPVFETIDIKQDIEFGEVINFRGNTEKLLLDVYSPAGDSLKNRPVILWIHGGGFRIGNDKSQRYIVTMASEFAKRGYVCLSINYRVRTNPKDDKPGTLTDALEDAMTGLNWLRNNAEKLNIDKTKIIVGGGSAGGRVAVNLCYKDQTETEKWDKSGIVGLVDLWGSPDQSWRMFEVDKNDTPAIIVHGTEDQSVLFANSEQLIKELKSSGVKYELVKIEGEGHTPTSHMDDFIVNISHFLYDLIK